MASITASNKTSKLWPWLVAGGVVWLVFAWQGHKGFDLWDEGFTWYGAQRTLQGEVPFRDFMSYDPARYYWSAAFMKLTGSDGLIAFRASNALLQMVAVYLALAAVTRNTPRAGPAFLILSAVMFTLWMLPYYKMADLFACILLISVFAYLIEAPSPGRYLLAGIGLGFAAFVGRNHGMYGLAAGGAILLWLRFRRGGSVPLFKAGCLFGLGVAMGFLPILLMAWVLPGFDKAFLDSIRFLFEFKATNLGVPVPWPWRVNFSAPVGIVLRDVLLGCFFIGALVFGVLSLAHVILRDPRKPLAPAFAAAAFLGLPYAHYAFSRADYYHLAFGIFPLLIGLLAWLATQRPIVKWAAAGTLLAGSVLTMFTFQTGWQCRAAAHCAEETISGSKILMEPRFADDVTLIRQLEAQYAPNGRSFVVAPLWPGAYALLDRRSPMWESYALFKRTEAFEKGEIARIEAAQPGFVFIFDHALDGHDELRFKNTHPLTHAYVVEHFERVRYPFRDDYQVYVSKGNAGLREAPPYLRLGAEELARLDRGASSVRILNWGPQEAVAGTVPNPQAMGNAGIWIQVADDADLGQARVMVDGAPASSSSVAPGVITAAVSPQVFLQPGDKSIAIEQSVTGRRIPVGPLKVTAPPTPP